MSLFNLKNKSVLITGSSKGIGKAIAYQCAEHGAKAVSYTHLTLPTKRVV